MDMAYIVLELVSRFDQSFKLDPKFHAYETPHGLTVQCKSCGEKGEFGIHARPSEIERFQINHDCMRPVIKRRKPNLLFEGVQPR
jgi:hypothetical protein